ncbi:T9SS type A sorting domain-containing protein [Arcticibacterium luteifluviistationis]|uniref:Secretion system C-terminal sorting domain-containing protein n=1 Tax=Arcticibacterium luteifluviistationis TaxID=1784714 RepID=A0A2Z4GE32_9BACT|nr:T9SS type A sorting domain-containing protein [Arcticibacterium luteifluviistationis]AWV99552.1 hypothetical protein DJ013_15805 [Arcticibacterium luteifluviistationis]
MKGFCYLVIAFIYSSQLYATEFLDRPNADRVCIFGLEESVLDCSAVLKLEAITPNFSKTFEESGFFALCKGSSAVLKLEIDIPNYDSINWYKADDIISSNVDSIVVTGEGSFYVKIFNGNCEYISPLIEIEERETLNVSSFLSNSQDEITICDIGGYARISGVQSGLGGSQAEFSWFRNEEEIIGANALRYTAKEEGAYQLKIEVDGCLGLSSKKFVEKGVKPSYRFDFATLEEKKQITVCDFEEGSNIPIVKEGEGGLFVKKDGVSLYGDFILTDSPGIYTLDFYQGSCRVLDTLRVLQSDSYDLSSHKVVHSLCEGVYPSLSSSHSYILNNGDFYWTRNDERVSSSYSPFHTPKEAGVYQLHFKSRKNSCIGKSDRIVLNEDDFGYPIRISKENDVEICSQQGFLMSHENRQSFSGAYQWMKDGETIENGTNYSYVAEESGSYQLILSEGGCSRGSNVVNIKVLDNPKIQLTHSCDSLSNSKLISLEADVELKGEVKWFVNSREFVNMSSSANSFHVDVPGTYVVEHTVGKCTYKTNALPIGASIADELEYCKGDSVLLDSKTERLYGAVDLFNFSKQLINNDVIEALVGSHFVRQQEEGCFFESPISLKIKDDISFSLSDTTVGYEGYDFTFKPTYGVLTDSTETPNYFAVISKDGEDTANGLLIDNLTSDSEGEYVIRASGQYGCTVEKKTYLKVEDSSLLDTVYYEGMSMLDFCYGKPVRLKVIKKGPGFSSNLLVRGLIFTGKDAFSFQGDTILAETFGDVLDFGHLPKSFYGKKIYVKIESANFKNVFHVSGTFELAESIVGSVGKVVFCDSMHLSSANYRGSEIQWYFNGKPFEEKGLYEITAKESGEYRVAEFGVNSGSNRCPLSAAEIDVEIGKINKPTVFEPPSSHCFGEKPTLYADYYEDAEYSWKRDGEIIEGANSGYLSRAEPGKYIVSVKTGSCEGISDEVVIADIATKETAFGLGLSIPISEDLGEPYPLCKNQEFILKHDVGSRLSGRRTMWFKDGELQEEFKSNEISITEDGEYFAIVEYGNCQYITKKSSYYFTDTVRQNLSIIQNLYNVEACRTNVSLYIDSKNGILDVDVSKPADWFFNNKPLKRDVLSVLNTSVDEEGSYYAVGTTTSRFGQSCPFKTNNVSVSSKDSRKNISLNGIKTISVCSDSAFLDVSELSLEVPRATNYTWLINGQIIEANKSQIVVKEAGEYRVKVDVKGGCSIMSDIYKVYLKEIGTRISGLPENVGKDDSIKICRNELNFLRLDLSNELSKSGYDIKWFIDDNFISNDEVLWVTRPGAYKLSLSKEGCQTVSNDFNFFERNEVEWVTKEEQVLCLGQEAKLEFIDSRSLDYIWLKDSKVYAINQMPSLSVSESGAYSVVSKDLNCVGGSKERVVFVDTLSTFIEVAENNTLICPNESSLLIGKEELGMEYALEFNGTEPKNISKPNIEVKDQGIYRIVYKRNGCVSKSAPILIEHLLDVYVFAESDGFCEGEAVGLMAVNNPANSFQWYRNNVEMAGANTASLNVSKEGAYFVNIISNECNSISDTLSIKKREASKALISGLASISLGDSAEINIELSSSGPWQVTLSDGSALSIENSPYQHYVSPVQTTEYTITALTDECGVGTFEGTATVNLMILGTEINGIENLNIYPNPTNSYVLVDYSSEENPLPTLTSMDGKNVPFSYDFSNGKMRIDLSRVAGGTYLLSLELEGVRTVKKLIKR